MICAKCGSSEVKERNLTAWILIIIGIIALFSFEIDTIFGGVLLIIAGFVYYKMKWFNKTICKICTYENRNRNTNTIIVTQEERTKRNYQTAKEEHLKYTKARKLVSDFTVLDFETTGFDAKNNKIIQLAAVKYRNFAKVEEFCTYVNPQESIPANITKITGITNDDVKNAPTMSEAFPQLTKFLKGEVIIAHNASFDMKFLLTNQHKLNIPYERYRVICTLSLARSYIHTTPNHKLKTLKSHLKLNHLKSHDSLHDCYVTAELYKYCYEQSLVHS